GPDVLAGMRTLWASPLSRGDAVRIAEPLGFLPEYNMLLQWPVPERQNLKDLIRSAAGGTAEARQALRAVMDKTAIGMAALHSSRALHGRTITWQETCDELVHTIKQLAAVNAVLAAVASRLLDRVMAFAASVPADPPVPTHGSFRPNQVLLYEGEVSFIDFDKFGQAEPALDLSLFLSATKNFALSRPHGEESDEEDVPLDPVSRLAILDQVDTVCAGFMEQYERCAPVSRARVVAWEALQLLELVLECWVKVKPVRLSNTLLMLERHLQAHGLL
ncbi:MAG TPA: phosphotransferase, partial [Planctomycetota bacterium]|nr:phosphotransferase [Planctomycetota bacterium]